jgi:hypothetical protein
LTHNYYSFTTQLRPHENDISTLSSTGIPAPLGSYHRKPKQETKQLICDDGFRETKTTNQVLHQNPRVHENKKKPVLSMINKYNISELNLVDRPVNATREGFGGIHPLHERSHDRRYFATENRTFYGEPHAETPAETLLK